MTNASNIFAKVDGQDFAGLIALFADDATMVFGNGEPLMGREAILAANQHFFTTITGLRHHIVDEYRDGPATIAVTDVTYTRLDGKDVTIPAASIWRVGEDGLIADYRIYFDVAPVFS
jgi:ketosteroid isomerase-like protein